MGHLMTSLTIFMHPINFYRLCSLQVALRKLCSPRIKYSPRFHEICGVLVVGNVSQHFSRILRTAQIKILFNKAATGGFYVSQTKSREPSRDYCCHLALNISSNFGLQLSGVITCSPWGLRDQEVGGRGDLDPLWLARLLERQEPYETDLMMPNEPDEFGGRLKRNYARPAIRMGWHVTVYAPRVSVYLYIVLFMLTQF